MNLLEMNNVILVLLVILCFTNIVENKSNGDNWYVSRSRHRRSRNEATSATKWLGRFPNEDRLSFQRHLIRELLSRDNRGSKLSNASITRWFKKKRRQIDNKYFNNDLTGYRKSHVKREWKRNKFKEKKFTRRKNRARKRESMEFREFVSLLRPNKFDFKHIATLKSQQTTEFHVGQLDKGNLSSNDQYTIMFDVTNWTNHHADHIKLVLYLSQHHDFTTTSTNSGSRDSLPCNCDVQIREIPRTSKIGVREGNLVARAPGISVHHNAWNSFDISEILISSNIFNRKNTTNCTSGISHNYCNNTDHMTNSSNSNNNNNYSSFRKSNNNNNNINNNYKNKKYIVHQNKTSKNDDIHGRGNSQTSGLLYLSITFSNCSSPNKGYIKAVPKVAEGDGKYTIFIEKQCVPNLRPVLETHGQNSDKAPLLILLSKKQKEVDGDVKKLNRSSFLVPNIPIGLNHPVSIFPSYAWLSKFANSIRNKEHENLKSSSSSTFPVTPNFWLNSKDQVSRNSEASHGFQILENNTSNDLVHTSMKPKKRLKRRARRKMGGRYICRRKEMYVDFTKMAVADFIAYPRGYQAYQCVGRCYSPISGYLTPTYHAIFQNLVHNSQPKKAKRACCVPTKLKAMSFLYLDEDKILHTKDLEGMIVAECGCR